MGAKSKKGYDFAGWVTKNDVKCSDGRTIRQNAFAHMDGKKVPLVYNHDHQDIENVLGHVLLENRPQGVYGYAKTNDTENGKRANIMVHSGDLVSFSIYANNLTETSDRDVMHGDIKEVSLVLAGANEEALIDEFFEHGVDGETGMFFFNAEGECEFKFGDEDSLEHADKDKEEEEDKEEAEDSEDEDGVSEEGKEDEDEEEEKDKKDLKHSDSEEDEKEGDKEEAGETLGEAYDKMPEKYKRVCAAMVGMVVSEEKNDKEEAAKHSDEGGEDVMKKNLFENDEQNQGAVLTHSDVKEILDGAKNGSRTLKQVFNDYCVAHSIDTTGMNILPDQSTAGQTYGVRDLDMLFPEYKAASNIPEFVKRDTTWADVVMAGVKRVPFKRLKSMFANITEDEARAKGYIKGDQKATEVFELLGRTTDPQTVYKMQELDRDDIIDIEDFDVVAWIKGEMQIMLREEIARAILIGDGRAPSNRHKIKEDHIRSIVNDVPLFNIKVNVSVPANSDPEVVYPEFIKAVLRARKNYKGSGNPVLYTTEDVLTECLLLEDKMGHSLYKTIEELATKLRVSRIVTVEVMEGTQVDSKPLMGVIVNLNDYTLGGDGNREKGMFEDFDIDFNQYKYLIETRASGALMKPYSAMTILLNETEAAPEG